MLYMLHDYARQCGDEAYQQLMAKVAATGVNMQRLQSYQKSYDEAMVNQAAAAAQAGEQAGEEAAPGGN